MKKKGPTFEDVRKLYANFSKEQDSWQHPLNELGGVIVITGENDCFHPEPTARRVLVGIYDTDEDLGNGIARVMTHVTTDKLEKFIEAAITEANHALHLAALVCGLSLAQAEQPQPSALVSMPRAQLAAICATAFRHGAEWQKKQKKGKH